MVSFSFNETTDDMDHCEEVLSAQKRTLGMLCCLRLVDE